MIPAILTLDQAILRFGREKRNGRRVAFTNGCFDLLHVGHLKCLEAGRRLADELVVGINSDSSIRQLKGTQRPLIPEGERAEILSAFEYVDGVLIFDDPTPREIIARLLPDVLFKGGDWSIDQIVGREEVEAAGGLVTVVPFIPGYSTTNLIRKIRECTPTNRADS